MTEQAAAQAKPKKKYPEPDGIGWAEMTKKGKAVRVLAIITLVLAVFAFFGDWLQAIYAGIGAADLINGTIAVTGSEMQDLLSSLGFGNDITEGQAEGAMMALVGMFFAFSGILAIININSSIGLLREPGKPSIGYRTYITAIISACVSLIALRPISAILYAVAAVLRHLDYEQKVGRDRDLAASGHMGVMRLMELACVFSLVINIFLLIFVTKSSYFDAGYWVSFIQLIMMAVTLWILWNKKQYGCQIIRVLVLVYMVLDLIVQLATGEFTWLSYLVTIALPLFMFFYFTFSRKAKMVLVQPFRMSNRKEQLAEDEKLWNPRSIKFWRNLLLYFCIFSVVGHWMEYWVCWLIRLGIVPGTYDPNSGIWRDMLNPFFVYGTAMVFIGLALFPLKNWLQEKLGGTIKPLIVSFLVNTLFCAIIELAMGLVLNQPTMVDGVLTYPLWDYSNMFCNFMGQICLLNTSFFGIMATLMTWLVYPNLEKAFAKIPDDMMNIVTVVILVFFALVVAMYVVNVSLPGVSA